MSTHLSFFVRQGVGFLCRVIKQRLRQWSRRENHALALNAAMDLKRSRSELMLGNMLLRQQMIVLKRQVKRPELIEPCFPGRLRLYLLPKATALQRRST